MNERCWTLLGSRDPETGIWRVKVHHLVTGVQASVEADWSWSLQREEVHGDVMGFSHTHPIGAGAYPSQRDVRTMQAWCSALGKPLLCLIVEEQKAESPQGYVFKNDEHDGEPVVSIQMREAGEFEIRSGK